MSVYTLPDATFRDNFSNVAEFLQHPNLAKLIATYVTHLDLAVLSEYMPNGTLASFLLDETKRATMFFNKRLEIAMEIIRALKHLHTNHRIPHGNVRANTVGLDRDMNVLLLDCCHHLFLNGSGRRALILDDGLEREGLPSLEDDVFSCGVLFLELLMGRKINEEDYNPFRSSPLVPPHQAMSERFEQLVRLGQLELFVDPKLLEMEKGKKGRLLVFAREAVKCFLPPAKRPTIKLLEEYMESTLKC